MYEKETVVSVAYKFCNDFIISLDDIDDDYLAFVLQNDITQKFLQWKMLKKRVFDELIDEQLRLEIYRRTKVIREIIIKSIRTVTGQIEMTIIQYPYSFKQFNEKILVVNAVGEHVFLSHQDFDYLVSENYDCLSKEGKLKLFSHNFISDINDKELVENLLAIKLRSRKDFLRYFTRLHMIVLTLRCNCHCDYCHASSKDLMAKNLDMTVETAKHVLDVIFQSPSPVLKIEFQGGEPTLNWQVLQYIVLSGEKKAVIAGKEIGFVVCTNLMSLTDSQVEFCKKHNIDISSSCDGPKFYHDLHRHALDKTSSYEAFLLNLKRIRKYKGKNSVNALLTITKDNLNHLPEIIDHYVALGFNSIFLRSLNPYGYAKKNLDELGYSFTDFVKYYKLALEYIFQLNESGIFFMESYASLIFQRIMTPFFDRIC